MADLKAILGALIPIAVIEGKITQQQALAAQALLSGGADFDDPMVIAQFYALIKGGNGGGSTPPPSRDELREVFQAIDRKLASIDDAVDEVLDVLRRQGGGEIEPPFLPGPPSHPPPTQPGGGPPTSSPPSGSWNPVIETDHAARMFRLLEPVRDWRDAIQWWALGFSGALHFEAELEIDTGRGPTGGGPQSFLYLRRDRDRWQNKQRTSGDCILLVDRSDNGALILSTTLSGQVVRSQPAQWPMGPSERVLLSVVIEGSLAWAQVERNGNISATTTLSLPAYTVASRLHLQAGQGATEGAAHPSNAGMSLLSLSGRVS